MSQDQTNHGHSEWVVLTDGSRWVPKYVDWCPRCREAQVGCPECNEWFSGTGDPGRGAHGGQS